MLNLYDAAAGAATPVVPARRGELRTYTAAAGDGERARAAALRSCLLADLVRRVGEQHGLLVSAWHGGGDAAAPDWEALNIHPPAGGPGPSGPVDVAIGAAPAAPAAHWLRSGPVEPGEVATSAAGGPYAAAVTGQGLDPLALRLALLQQHYRQPVSLAWDGLGVADQLLAGWRRQVATWANSPSKPMSAGFTGDIKAAFDNDLDAPAALAAVTALAADPGIPAGSKFETFVYVDHWLGLDLARDIGKV